MEQRTSSSKLAAAGAAILLAGLTLAAGLPASLAHAAPAADAGSVVSSPAISSPSAGGTVDAVTAAYWTPDRMRAAIAADVITLQGAPHAAQAQAPQGSAGSFPAALPAAGTLATAAGVVSPDSVRVANGFVSYPYTSFPLSTEGKVFFTQNKIDYVCSGAAINSPHKWLVMTAGHCVIQGGSGNKWDTSFMFCPDYYYGSCPYGKWYAHSYMSLTGWVNSADYNNDIGAVIMNPNGATQIVNAVGGQGINWNWPVNENFTAFGYPAASPFNGQQLYTCSSATTQTDGGNPGINCAMTGGASGGSWYMNYSFKTGGNRDGHNDYVYSSQPGVIYSPYYGDNAKNLFNAAG